MTTRFPQHIPFLFLIPEDLFRFGNSTSPRLDNVRTNDVDTRELDGQMLVIANGKGMSLRTQRGIDGMNVTGWLWKIPKEAHLPEGLALHNDRGQHWMICPTGDMPVTRFKELLTELASRCERVGKV